MPKRIRLKGAGIHNRNRSPKYPIATLAYYGPDDTLATKMVVGIVADESGDVVALEKWFALEGDIRADGSARAHMLAFIGAHGATTISTIERMIGCPHEEGIDYPEGGKCPLCPFWASRDRWTGEPYQ